MKKNIIILCLLMAASFVNAQCVTADCKSTISYPQDTITLNGHITFSDGIKSILWTNKVGVAAIVNPTQASAVAKGLSTSTSTLYTFLITVVSTNGTIGTYIDSVVYVSNKPPVAVPGPPVTTIVPVAALSGSGSFDPDGFPITYSWTEASGPNTAVITSPAMANPIVSGMVNGVYSFRLTVTDKGGLTNSGIQQVTVAIPLPPAATIIKTITVQTITLSDGSIKIITTQYP